MQRGETGGCARRLAAPHRLLITVALAQLSAEHREVIRLSYYRGWTTAQIADNLDVPEWFVKSRLHLALRALPGRERQSSRCALNAADRQRLHALLATACEEMWGREVGGVTQGCGRDDLDAVHS